MTSPVLAFYRDGDSPLQLDAVLRYDTERFECDHTFIQWLFPLPEPSRYNPDAPILTDADIAEFHHDGELRDRMKTVLAVVVSHYGLMVLDYPPHGKYTIARDPATFFKHVYRWCVADSHHFLRFTRMMRCMTLVGLHVPAKALLHCLQRIEQRYPGVITEKNLTFWSDACIIPREISGTN